MRESHGAAQDEVDRPVLPDLLFHEREALLVELLLHHVVGVALAKRIEPLNRVPRSVELRNDRRKCTVRLTLEADVIACRSDESPPDDDFRSISANISLVAIERLRGIMDLDLCETRFWKRS